LEGGYIKYVRINVINNGANRDWNRLNKNPMIARKDNPTMSFVVLLHLGEMLDGMLIFYGSSIL
jgi:hypothetical protein